MKMCKLVLGNLLHIQSFRAGGWGQKLSTMVSPLLGKAEAKKGGRADIEMGYFTAEADNVELDMFHHKHQGS